VGWAWHYCKDLCFTCCYTRIHRTSCIIVTMCSWPYGRLLLPWLLLLAQLLATHRRAIIDIITSSITHGCRSFPTCLQLSERSVLGRSRHTSHVTCHTSHITRHVCSSPRRATAAAPLPSSLTRDCSTYRPLCSSVAYCQSVTFRQAVGSMRGEGGDRDET
jgi:hypothetical protein